MPIHSLAWFGAVRVDKKPLKYELEHKLLSSHTHSLQKPASHYLEPPKLPPEDLEPAADAEARERERRRKAKQLRQNAADARAPAPGSHFNPAMPGQMPQGTYQQQNPAWHGAAMNQQNPQTQMPPGYGAAAPRAPGKLQSYLLDVSGIALQQFSCLFSLFQCISLAAACELCWVASRRPTRLTR